MSFEHILRGYKAQGKNVQYNICILKMIFWSFGNVRIVILWILYALTNTDYKSVELLFVNWLKK